MDHQYKNNVDINRLNSYLAQYNMTGDNTYIELMYKDILTLSKHSIIKYYPHAQDRKIKIEDAATRLLERIIKGYKKNTPYVIEYWLTVIKNEVLYQVYKDRANKIHKDDKGVIRKDYITKVISLDDYLDRVAQIEDRDNQEEDQY